MTCECSGLEYIFDFPTFKTKFDADTMDVDEGSDPAENGNPIWLCLWPHVESLTTDPNMHPRVTVVKANFIVD